MMSRRAFRSNPLSTTFPSDRSASRAPQGPGPVPPPPGQLHVPRHEHRQEVRVATEGVVDRHPDAEGVGDGGKVDQGPDERCARDAVHLVDVDAPQVLRLVQRPPTRCRPAMATPRHEQLDRSHVDPIQLAQPHRAPSGRHGTRQAEAGDVDALAPRRRVTAHHEDRRRHPGQHPPIDEPVEATVGQAQVSHLGSGERAVLALGEVEDVHRDPRLHPTGAATVSGEVGPGRDVPRTTPTLPVGRDAQPPRFSQP